jgi:hypothetical protein
MACSINLQDKAIKNIRVKRRVLRSLDDVVAEINSVPELSSYTLDKAVEELEDFFSESETIQNTSENNQFDKSKAKAKKVFEEFKQAREQERW